MVMTYDSTTLTLHNHTCILFGGHDGSRHLNDVHVYDFGTFSSGLFFFYLTFGNEISETRVWSLLATEGPAPLARDSHVAVIHSNSMYIFGGSTGTAVNDFYELKLGKWSINWLEFRPIDPDDQL
ncbi:hypothetical protein PsorP6_007487 [Peronosclerospora sorghi]|uniref:Uncharacterized protein n=1 Tax=Peronosclerospora sorghi TaxID=230839 RepID=A0ACC0WBV4_9STRA|nr:hypothetical protein PsorP6_007487 [Peronosclerospora sorghi]